MMSAQTQGGAIAEPGANDVAKFNTLDIEARAREMQQRFIRAQIAKMVRGIGRAVWYALDEWRQRNRRHRKAHALLDLDDRLLADVGLLRSDVVDYVETGRPIATHHWEDDRIAYVLWPVAQRHGETANNNRGIGQAA